MALRGFQQLTRRLVHRYRCRGQCSTHKDGPRAQIVGPSLRSTAPWIVRRGVGRAAGGNESLLNKAAALIPPDLSVKNFGETGFGVLVAVLLSRGSLSSLLHVAMQLRLSHHLIAQGWALVPPLFFRQAVVVTPSAPLASRLHARLGSVLPQRGVHRIHPVFWLDHQSLNGLQRIFEVAECRRTADAHVVVCRVGPVHSDRFARPILRPVIKECRTRLRLSP